MTGRRRFRGGDYADDLFTQARAALGDPVRLAPVLAALARLYNPLVNGPIVDLATRERIMRLAEAGRAAEAGALLEERYRSYAPVEDRPREDAGPGA